MKLGINAASSICALLVWAAPVWASAPNLLTYQGRLLESGVPVNGTRGVQFKICDDAGGTSCSAAVVVDPVTVTNGLYRAVFVVPVDVSGGVKHLEVSVGPSGGGPYTLLLPREQLTSSAYAIHASTAALATKATTLVTSTPNDFGAFISTHVALSGSSNLGLGVSDTQLALDLQRAGGPAAIVSATGYGGSAPLLRMRKALGTQTTPTAVTSGFILGTLDYYGYDGAAGFQEGAYVRAIVEQDWGASAHGTRLVLATTQNGGTTAQERMRIDNAGNVSIGTMSTGGMMRLDVQKDGDSAVVGLTGYGAAGGSELLMRRARGTQASPTAVLNTDTVGELAWMGYDGSSFGDGGSIRINASQNWSAGNRGAEMIFGTVKNGQTTNTDRMLLSDSGLSVVADIDATTMTVSGHIHANSGVAPTLSACNSGVIGSLTGGSGDVAGRVTFNSGGGATTTCTINFGTPWGGGPEPVCIVQGSGTPSVASVSYTSLIVSGTWGTLGETFRYICIGQ